MTTIAVLYFIELLSLELKPDRGWQIEGFGCLLMIQYHSMESSGQHFVMLNFQPEKLRDSFQFQL
jgi:hypothetical protein